MRSLVFLTAFVLLVGSSGLTALAADTKTISAVEVQEQDGVTRIVLRGAEDPIYTAFMREDPPRLIVELPDVEFSGVDTPIQVGNGLVQEVALGAFGDPRVALSMARVSVRLTRESEYELLPDGDELVIVIRPLAEGAANATTVAETAPLVAETETQPLPAAPEKSAPAPVKDEGTSRLLTVAAHGSEVEVVADGPIDNYDSFTLENPSRLVVDFWGVKSGVWPASQTVAEGAIEKWRVGEHADKVRVVLDLRDGPAAHEVLATSTGVRIHLGDAPVQDDPNAAAEAADELPAAADEAGQEAPLEEAAEGGELNEGGAEQAAQDDAERELPPSHFAEPARVESVHFESLPETDRVVISMNHPTEAELVRPDDATVIVMLKDTLIESDSERRVDTKDFGGPIEHFSVFHTPDVDYEEVRIVLKRHGAGESSLTWNENQLHVELPRAATEAAWQAPTDGAQPAGDGSTVPNAADPAAGELGPAADGGVPVPAPGQTSGTSVEDPFLLDGPADPASIDILAEGGFSDEKEYTGRRVSLDFKDADIANILRLIAEVSDLNVIAGEEVDGTVTIRLVDVPWDQALDVILLTKGLGFVRVGNVLRIAPLETIKLEAEARLQDRRAREKLEDLVVKLQPVNYADVKDIRDLVKKLLSKRGTVNTDKRTNTLIIKDIPSVVQEATALVKAIDTATPQVLIESKIVEATLSFSRALGATWGLGYQPFKDVPSQGLVPGGTDTSTGGGGDVHLGDGGLPDLIGLGGGSQLSNFIAANPIFENNTGFLSLGLLGLDDHLQLDLAIEAAESNNKGKVISSPRVVTLDNKEAVIKQGVAIKFEASTNDKITISFIDAVLELKVTPHITANRSIIMKIKISRNAPSLAAATGEIVGIDKNEAETEALIRDGETIVLGGIYVVDSGKSGSKTPFLADIPLLGAAFKSRVIKDTRRELLIFVTPRIIMGTPGTAQL